MRMKKTGMGKTEGFKKIGHVGQKDKGRRRRTEGKRKKIKGKVRPTDRGEKRR